MFMVLRSFMRFILDHRYVGKFNFKVTQKQVLTSVNNLSRNGKKEKDILKFPICFNDVRGYLSHCNCHQALKNYMQFDLCLKKRFLYNIWLLGAFVFM